MKYDKYLITEVSKQMPARPKPKDIKFILDYAKDHNRDFGSDIPLTKAMATKAYKQIRDNCNGVEEEFYYAMKEYFAN